MKYSKLRWSRKLQWHLCASFDDLPLPGFSEFSSILTLSLCSMYLLMKSERLFVLLRQLIVSCGSIPAKKKWNSQTVLSHTLWPLKGHRWVINWWCLAAYCCSNCMVDFGYSPSESICTGTHFSETFISDKIITGFSYCSGTCNSFTSNIQAS